MTSIYTNNSYNKSVISNDLTPSLNQGDLFKNYQNKIKSKTKTNDKYSKNKNDLVEGFETNTNNNNSITEQSQSLLKQTEKIEANKKNVSQLKKKYKSSLTQYDDLTNTRNKQTQDYYDRIDPNKNPYLNQNICLSNGSCGYVTNQGVFKPYPKDNDVTYNNTAGKNGCPSTAYKNINGEGDINAIGSMTTSTPSLLIGTPMVSGQSCGYEGNNIYVDKMLPPDMSANYLDVYGTTGNPEIKFIGGGPPPAPIGFNGIQNGNFDTPRMNDNSYKEFPGSNKVPGWEFHGDVYLMNNSKRLFYPRPYPNGSQAVSIRGNGNIKQTLNMPVGTYTLSVYAIGRPYGNDKVFNPLDIKLNDKTIYTIKPTSSWVKNSVPINIETTGNYTIRFNGTTLDLSAGQNHSTAIQKVELVAGSIKKADSTSNGTYTYDMCKETAMINGYQYFGLQDVNTEKSKGYCAVTNDYVSLTEGGQDRIIQSTIILWESKTTGEGVSAKLSGKGSLEVYDSTGKVIFNTPPDDAVPGYIGCFSHRDTRNRQKNREECAAYARGTYYALAGGSCNVSNKITDWNRDGKANNCVKTGDYYTGVEGSSLAIYTKNIGSMKYCLQVKDDGNMTITKGNNPNDNQGEIWESGTKDKVQDANPMYAAAKGKFGAPWVSSGKTLARGEFIGSIDGKCALVMQNDGNLVLCTWQMGPNEVLMADRNTGGGEGAAGFYDLSEVGIRNNFGKVGFVDENAALHEYPETNLKFTTNYTKFTGVNCPGSDIPNAAYDNSTVEKCEATCNSMENCAGFVFQTDISRCWPKDKGIYPNSDIYTSSRDDTYLRSKEPIQFPNGIESGNLIGTDTILYQNYVNGGGFDQKFGLPKALEKIQQKVETKGKQLNTYGNKVQGLTYTYSTLNNKLTEQSKINFSESDRYLSELDKTNSIMQNMDNGMDNILNDTDIMVLQKNYSYLFWSIIAIGTVIVSMNIVKKN
jgi:hypothetical protein